jgi:subtilisin family serine protease
LSYSLRKGATIRLWLHATILLLLPAFAVSAADPRPGRARAVPDEIIVKLRAQPADQMARPDGSNDRGPIPRALQIRHDHARIREMKLLMPDFDRRHARLQALHARDESRQTPLEKHLVRRQKRGQPGNETPGLERTYRIRVQAETRDDVLELLNAYRRSPDVEYAELNHVVSICAEPNDPWYASQWALTRIAAAEAWDTCRGSEQIVVAVIDTGIDYTHRDLRDNVWRNEAELYGLPGVDDDDNGYVDDVYGYNFAYNNSDPVDDHGHGTHCAGIIAAEGNNGIDTTGVCWKAQIMSIKILDAQGDGTSADAVPAIYYAVANGADVISGSWGGPDESQLVKEAVAYARRQGVIVVAAAGNKDTDTPFYPAAYPDVIAVAATEPSDARWYLSNYGNWVDVAAPGRDILSLRAAGALGNTGPDPFTSKLSGTSMAAPYVAGACALLLAANPLLTCDEVEQIVLSTGDPIASGICASNSRLNVAKAMRAAVPAQASLRFDRPVYGAGDAVSVQLADWDVRATGGQSVEIDTEAGDVEIMPLVPTPDAWGVFRGSLLSECGEAKAGDGRIQVQHGQRIVARYRDFSGDGTGQWAEAVALADYEAPALVQETIDIRGPVARIELMTSEPSRAEIRYGTVGEDSFPLTAGDGELGERHSIKLMGLALQAEYRFVVALTDEAGNETIADNGGSYYAFTTAGDFPGFRVPGVYPTIQAAIDDAWTGDTIWVADGTYSGEGNVEIDFGGREITVRSENGPGACIIDGRGGERAFYFHNGESPQALVEGFTISGGGDVNYGGAIRCVGSSPTIRNCIFTRNSADQYGGAMDNSYGSSPAVIGCTFEGNTSSSGYQSGRGGAIANRQDSSPTIEDCVFLGNFAGYGGGAIGNLLGSNPRIFRCVFTGNSTGRYGGAVADWDNSYPTLTQCVFVDNSARADGGSLCNRSDSGATLTNCLLYGSRADGIGGAIGSRGGAVTLTNCTIADNRAGARCGGVWSGDAGDVQIENCILWANVVSYGAVEPEPAQVLVEGGDIRIDYSCIQGLSGVLGGVGNIGQDPLFVGDYHLKSRGWRWEVGQGGWTRDDVTSPCIDAGNPARPLGDERTTVPDDPNGLPVGNTRINMGAYGGTAEASLAPFNSTLLADVNNDGLVDWLDLAWVAGAWLTDNPARGDDLSRDGRVNWKDIIPLAAEWRANRPLAD